MNDNEEWIRIMKRIKWNEEMIINNKWKKMKIMK